MTATNHALTGAAIGLISGQPAIAIPVALASHYVCDLLPHFRLNMPPNKLIKTRWFRNYLVIEALVCFLIVLALGLFQPPHWQLAAVCAFVAAAPDLVSVNRYLKVRAGRKWKPGRYTSFAMSIQWFERPAGALVEIAWFIAAIAVIVPFIG